jgi:hypothetical protein
LLLTKAVQFLRKKSAFGTARGSTSQRYLHLSHDDKVDDHDDPLLTMGDDGDMEPTTVRA